MDAEKINATDAVRLFGGAGYMEGAIVEMDAGCQVDPQCRSLKVVIQGFDNGL